MLRLHHGGCPIRRFVPSVDTAQSHVTGDYKEGMKYLNSKLGRMPKDEILYWGIDIGP